MAITRRQPVPAASNDWPDAPMSDGPAPRGHNRPPIEEVVKAEFRDALLSERPDFLDRVDQFIAAVDRAQVTDDDTLGRAGDLDKMLRAADAHVVDVHKTVKQPYLDGGRAVDAEKKAITDRIASARFTLKDGMNAFVAQREAARRAEEARRAAEERRMAEEARAAEVARQEAEGVNDPEAIAAIEVAPLAAAVTQRAEPVRSDAGATVSTRQVWNSQVENFAQAFKAVKDDPKVQEAISAAVARLVKAGKREIAGVKIWPTQQAVAR